MTEAAKRAFAWLRTHSPYLSFGLHLLYAVGHMALGVYLRSWWFITTGVYYAVLAASRWLVWWLWRRAKGDSAAVSRTPQYVGRLLVLLSCCVAGINVLAIVEGRGTAFHEIVMITIATYTFTRITIAVVEMVRARRHPSPLIQTLRNLSLASACVSVYSMQRSMLVSFPGLPMAEIQFLNICTGTAVWLIVLSLGINLMGGKYTTMAKSKIVKVGQKIAAAVTDGYHAIETGVVDGYKKIEKGVVDGYTKVEDTFVDTYLTREGETVEDAKSRLKGEKEE